MSYETVRDKLARGETVLLDGGVGTEILRRGVYWRDPGNHMLEIITVPYGGWPQ